MQWYSNYNMSVFVLWFLVVLSWETKNIFSSDFIYSSHVGICEQLVPVIASKFLRSLCFLWKLKKIVSNDLTRSSNLGKSWTFGSKVNTMIFQLLPACWLSLVYHYAIFGDWQSVFQGFFIIYRQNMLEDKICFVPIRLQWYSNRQMEKRNVFTFFGTLLEFYWFY